LLPFEWAGPNVAWAPSSAELYFVDRADGASIRRYRIGSAAAEATLATAADQERIVDLHVSSDGRTLAYLVVTSSGPATATLQRMDLATGQTRAIGQFDGSVSLRGWHPGRDALVLLRQNRLEVDRTAEVEVLIASGDDAPQPVGRIEGAFPATARLSPVRPRLYVTRSAAGVHNLYSFDLGTGRLTRLTDNSSPGVTFSGIDPLAGDALVGVRSERQSDVWLIDFGAEAGAAAGPPAQ
jgi:hypothetical protein